jgi:hypothetical protein
LVWFISYLETELFHFIEKKKKKNHQERCLLAHHNFNFQIIHSPMMKTLRKGMN